MAKGYAGKILHVDLKDRRTWVEEPDDVFYRRYMGGPGIGLHYLLKEMQPRLDALSPANVLTFAAGTLAGTTGPAVCRFTVCAKSPLTGTAGKSEAAGWWGPALKMAGWDAVVIRGRASEPVYLWIDDDRVEFRDASHLWGKATGEVQDLIRHELGDTNVRVAQIGRAGENQVRFANITNELAHFNGRGGLGAVMGSKLLRAIAVRAGASSNVRDRAAVAAITRWVTQNMSDHPLASSLHRDGTPAGIASVNSMGALPTNNWSSGVFAKADEIGSEALNNRILLERKGCFSCPIRCKRVVRVDNGQFQVDPKYGGPEYETLVALGSNCGIGNLELLAKANEVCNALALDTISLGMTISFAMACFEKGLIDETDTRGMVLRFGNEDILLPLINMIARREGFGAVLAEGSVRVAAVIGKGAEESLLHAKGQEVPMHDPRVKTGLGLQYALSCYGADHWIAQHDPLFAQSGSPGLQALSSLGILEPVPPLDLGPRKVRAFYHTQMLTSAYDLLGVCVFGAVARSILPLDKLVDLVSAVTGWDVSLWELLKAGERATSMARIFNWREGLTRADDSIPSLFFTPFADGPLEGTAEISESAFGEALDLYHQMAGWDVATGKPTRAKLEELSLGWAI